MVNDTTTFSLAFLVSSLVLQLSGRSSPLDSPKEARSDQVSVNGKSRTRQVKIFLFFFFLS